MSCSVSAGLLLVHLALRHSGGVNQTPLSGPRPPYLAVTAHLVALAEALLLGGAQGVPEHDVIAQGHMHAPARLRLACRKERARHAERQERSDKTRRGTNEKIWIEHAVTFGRTDKKRVAGTRDKISFGACDGSFP